MHRDALESLSSSCESITNLTGTGRHWTRQEGEEQCEVEGGKWEAGGSCAVAGRLTSPIQLQLYSEIVPLRLDI